MLVSLNIIELNDVLSPTDRMIPELLLLGWSLLIASLIMFQSETLGKLYLLRVERKQCIRTTKSIAVNKLTYLHKKTKVSKLARFHCLSIVI